MTTAIDTPINSLREKIDSIRFCMLTTLNDDRSFSSRPMTQQAIDNDGTLWFFTSDDSQLALDIIRHPQIGVTFANPSDNVYVAISGEAELLKNRLKAEQLWNSGVQAWFPLGPHDPHLSLIKFTVHEAEYWDSDTNKMLQLFSIAKAVLTGHRPKHAGDHVKLHFDN